MKIVIDIPEDVYTRLFDNGVDASIDDLRQLETTVRKGTPIPKGHGDLIDRIEVIKSLFDYHNGKKTIGQCIDDVPITIEADKEEEK